MGKALPELVEALLRAKSFEEAATKTLRAMMLCVNEAIAAGPYARRGRLLRGLVHLRPADSYRRLLVLDEEAAREGELLAGGRGAAPAGSEADLLPSTTAWRAITEHRCAVSIDVKLGTLELHSGAPDAREAGRATGEVFHGDASRQRFLGRHASHVHALPLRLPGNLTDGMFLLEAECLAAVGQDFVWDACTRQLQLMVDLAAPHLVGLPSCPAEPSQTDELLPVVGASMAGLVSMLRVFAWQEETLLLGGHTGVGKSRMARWCHARSARRDGPFETVELLTVPAELQMAELFGWRKGAFSGSTHDMPGAVARAEGGTLFLDEIDKLSLNAQAGLLNLLEERTYRPLGDSAGARRADVRFIVGTNADLRAAVRAGQFREDLYYRINVLPVRLPPLAERTDEIPGWARYMLGRRHAEARRGDPVRLSPEAERLLVRRAWPGNLRQLDNVVRRAYTLALVGQAEGAGELLLREPDMERALAYEDPGGREALPEAMQAAAAAFVETARRRGEPLDLDLAEALRGYVLGVAVRREGRDKAFRLVAREGLVKNRNHQKALRRELERVESLCRVLGVEFPFADVMREEASDT